MVNKLTDAQYNIITALDDTAEHVAWEFNADNYEETFKSGSVYIGNIDGRCSFIQNINTLSSISEVKEISESSEGYKIKIGKLKLSIKNLKSGYEFSIVNITDYVPRQKSQQLDVQKRLHSLVLNRLKYNGYLEDAYIME